MDQRIVVRKYRTRQRGNTPGATIHHTFGQNFAHGTLDVRINLAITQGMANTKAHPVSRALNAGQFK